MDSKTFKGQLKRWNEDKGFGFISSENGKRDVFIHVSALKTMSRRPVVGDMISYQIHTDNDGKNRAVNAKIEGVAAARPSARRKNKNIQNKNNWFYQLFLLLLLISAGFFFYNNIIKEKYLPTTSSSSLTSTSKEELYEESYSCAGKVYCSEMTSCEEAKFYQRNCPGTKMDGDGDGVPCESQWCSW